MKHLNNVDWHATDRCNLKCISCGHFCSLVDNTTNISDRTPKQAENDFKILYDKTNKGEFVDNITITGGEPTLNKNLTEILSIANKYFTNKITLWTNAINLNLFTDELINFIEQNNIHICVTIYEVNKSFNRFLNLFYPSTKITFYIKNYLGKNTNEFFTKFFTCNKIDNIDDNTCYDKFVCCQLKDSKLYPCQYLGYISYLFDYFGDKYKTLLEYDKSNIYLDLNNISSYDDLYKYLEQYNEPICQHCLEKWTKLDFNNRAIYRVIPWETSKQNINEWICDNIDDLINEN